MNKLHIALCQGHWTGQQETTKNLYRLLIGEAAGRGASLICLPEFSILPYFAGTRAKAGFKWAESLAAGTSHDFFSEMAKSHQVTLVGSIFEQDGENYWDTALIYSAAGELKYYTRKVHIPSGEGYHETDFFEGYSEFPVHDIGAIKMATPTCYDQWFPEVARIYALNGAEFIFYPTAIGSEPTAPEFDSQQAWQTVMRGHAVANGVFIAACNRVGKENAVTFYGSSFICDPLGNIIAQASRDADEVLDIELDPAVREQYLDLFPLLHQRRPQHYQGILDKAIIASPQRWQDEKGFEG
jgi:N-carbamoylputrescine amidase